MGRIRILAAAMAVVLSIQMLVPVRAQATYSEAFQSEVVEDVQPEPQAVQTEEPTEEVPAIEDESSMQEEPEGGDSTSAPAVYQNGVILLYSYEQLCAVGSGQPVRTGDAAQLGSGQTVMDDQGREVVYGLDGEYKLMNDIPLDGTSIWTLPQEFTGHFVSDSVEKDAPLYDGDTDTIYVYHNYQLLTIASETAAQEPVMSGDMYPDQFGVGNFVYAQNEGGDTGPYLTYDPNHKYLLSKNFTQEMPEMIATVVERGEADPAQLGGRSHIGQVYAEIDGTKYILIGNEQQLAAIGTDAQVAPMLFVRTETKVLGGLGGTYVHLFPYYPGDADINLRNLDETGFISSDIEDSEKEFLYFQQDPIPTGLWNPDLSSDNLLEGISNLLKDILNGLLGLIANYKAELVGLKDENTDSPSIGKDSGGLFGEPEYMTFEEVKATYQDLKYTSDANYIIFRDIDLNKRNSNPEESNWTPLMFSGTMIGAKAQNGEKLTDGSAITATGRPVISNVRVIQKDALKVNEYMGIGFFATISNEINRNNVGISAGQVRVENLELENISVQTKTSDTEQADTILNALTSSLGWIVGGLLDLVTTIITVGNVKLNLRDTLSGLLNARVKNPTRFATGAFAGRVEGDVRVEDCIVTNATVTNQNDYTGGFVGYAVGVTEYDGLSDTLGLTVDVLSSLLNAIPGLGLGDLITILLDNGLAVGNLIPTGYYNPVMENCHVKNLNAGIEGHVLGSTGTDYAGGFVGAQVGTRIIDCSVVCENDYTVQAATYGGGFSGLARDAEIKGLLTDVGVELVRVTQPQSLLLNCKVVAPQVTVTGGENLGGFVGALANSYAINDTMEVPQMKVTGSGSCVGGFAGIATVGWISNLGKDETTESSLLSTVKQLLNGLLSTEPAKVQMLLSLVGIQPSAILGCQINPNMDSGVAYDIRVQGNGCVGGFVGKGDGLYLTESSQTYLKELPLWKWKGTSAPVVTERENQLKGISSVTASGDYAGGISGCMGAASVTGLLNGTLGVGNFLGFTATNFSVNGGTAGYTVDAAGDYAGGAFGLATGGQVTKIQLHGLASVTANNRAGGFVGCAGPGDLAGSSGLKLGLLGLELLELKNLLSVAEGVRVQIQNCTVNGIASGFTVTASGSNAAGEVVNFVAGGFIGQSNSTQIENSHVYGLKSVLASNVDGFAGGYVGTSHTGGLAEVAQEDDILTLIKADNLLGAVGYLIPTYTNCTVTYQDGGYVQADVAGGFVGELQSGKVDNQSRGEADYYAVYNIDHVRGQTYGGGFGGKVYSGALADAGGGISILGGIDGLNISVDNLLNVIQAYVPYVEYAGVKSDNGFTVTANQLDDLDSHSGSAGGFIGYASGAQISTCDVTYLKHTKVTPPDDLEAVDTPSYFNEESSYAVTGGRYAGGFVGCMDIGSAASVGSGLGVLGQSIQLTDVLRALSVVVTTIEHSDVTGGVGGYSVRANQTDASGAVGHAGGFAGAIYGGHIQNSNAHNFEYVIGQISAGGYVGEMEPGDVAKLLDQGSILDKVLNIKESVASLLQSFVPTIRNSSTDAVPCGGVVRAQTASDATIQRGMAGGYVGHNMGGSSWGLNTDPWKTALTPYDGPTSICKAERIRSVYGAEYAGGYTGFMEAADTAHVGGLRILDGLISVNNILGALSVVYPTQENTAVYGPLANLTVGTWNQWVEYVGQYGGYGYELAQTGKVENQDELNAKLEQYVYGFHVVAGRSQKDTLLPNPGGDAGGYVGLMRSGTLTNCMAYDVKLVRGWRAAGGYAGSMETGGAANFGSVSILGLNLNVGQLVDLAELFVPAVKNSSVYGYTSGLTVQATGLSTDGAGYAGGYVGCSYGAQIQLNDQGLPAGGSWAETSKYPAPTASCDVGNLRRVTGRNAIGGYVGLASAASLASVNTNASDGLLQGILDSVISKAGDLIQVLPATYTTIHKASVSPADGQWGFVVDGAYTTDTTTVQYAPFAGGFAGYVQAAVLGEKGAASDVLTVTGLRSVDGGLYAGGFLGLADVAAVAEVGDTDGEGSTVDVIGAILNLGSIDALDVLRCYIYHAGVTGVEDGYTVQAHSENSQGILDETRHTGCAGGFVGGLMNGTIQNGTATNLSTVQALNYTGGFVGHMGKSGVVDVDSVELLAKLVNLGVGVGDLLGSQIFDSSVTGIAQGAIIQATGGKEPIAGGFSGYSDLGRIKNSTVTNLKKVTSDQIAGGFMGKTDMAYLVSVGADSPLVKAVLIIVDELLKALYVNDTGLESIDLVDLNLGILKVEVLNDGNTLKVELLGLPITVALSKKADNPHQQTDVAIVTIGDSMIRLPCDEHGLTEDGEKQLAEAEINLIKGNRTELESCTVTGVANGYDVFGGGATQDADGTHANGMAGGFVGYNHEGKISDSQMVLCDVVRGTAEQVGPFTGYNDLKSVYDFNTVENIEGDNNTYSIYRPSDTGLTAIQAGGQQIGATAAPETVGGTAYNRYDIKHITDFGELVDTGKELSVYDTFLALKGAIETGIDGTQRDLNAYVSDAKAVLMLDTQSPDNPPSTVPEPGENADPCSENVDLTIQKIWEDWFNLGQTRPDSITIRVYQQKFDTNGAVEGSKVEYETIELTKANQESVWSAVWSTVLKDVPLYEYTDTNGNGVRDQDEPITAYYVYTVEEVNVPAGYVVTYEPYDPDQAGDYTLTITNTLSIPLPDTGGIGSAIFVVVGVGILLPALTIRKRRSRGRED